MQSNVKQASKILTDGNSTRYKDGLLIIIINASSYLICTNRALLAGITIGIQETSIWCKRCEVSPTVTFELI
jgi:hypothetical protein